MFVKEYQKRMVQTEKKSKFKDKDYKLRSIEQSK
jgi:hypothetical protein